MYFYSFAECHLLGFKTRTSPNTSHVVRSTLLQLLMMAGPSGKNRPFHISHDTADEIQFEGLLLDRNLSECEEVISEDRLNI